MKLLFFSGLAPFDIYLFYLLNICKAPLKSQGAEIKGSVRLQNMDGIHLCFCRKLNLKLEREHKLTEAMYHVPKPFVKAFRDGRCFDDLCDVSELTPFHRGLR